MKGSLLKQFIKRFGRGRTKLYGQLNAFGDHLWLTEKVNDAVEAFIIWGVGVLRVKPSKEPVLGDLGKLCFRTPADRDDDLVPSASCVGYVGGSIERRTWHRRSSWASRVFREQFTKALRSVAMQSD